MKKALLPTNAQTLFTEVSKILAEKLGTRISRHTVSSAYTDFVVVKKRRSLKALNLIFDFTSAQILKVAHVEADIYNVTFTNGEERFAFADESISAYNPTVVVAKKAKVAKVTDGMRFAVAMIRPSRKGNTRFLHKNGKFNASYANRYVYNTLKGAENLIARIYDNNEMKINTLKVVSA